MKRRAERKLTDRYIIVGRANTGSQNQTRSNKPDRGNAAWIALESLLFATILARRYKEWSHTYQGLPVAGVGVWSEDELKATESITKLRRNVPILTLLWYFLWYEFFPASNYLLIAVVYVFSSKTSPSASSLLRTAELAKPAPDFL